MRQTPRLFPLPCPSRAIVLTLCLWLLVGCGSQPMVAVPGSTDQGEASWYSDAYQGAATASGERYRKAALTAAHRSLPFGTRVRVTHLENRRQVVVRVNDRGPFVRGRIIDLSRAAAERLGMIRSGVAPVRIEVVR